MTPTRETILRLTAERDAALKSAAAWEVQAQDATDRARRAEEERDYARLRLDRDGGRLADEVAALVRRRVIDSRSPAADALLDFRSPPSSPRADRLAALERQNWDLTAERDAAQAELAALRARLDVPWREGLPSVEQVRAHEARGGWWQKRLLPTQDLSEVNYLHITVSDRYSVIYGSAHHEYRPCSTNGTPLPWPEAPGT